MNKYINQWNSLDTVGKKGQGMNGRKDYLHGIAINLHYYASILSLGITVIGWLVSYSGLV